MTDAERQVPRPDPAQPAVPLCVDLDGTLIRTDLLIEGVLALLKSNPLYVFLFPLWLLKGKARFKREVAERVDLDPALLPYHGPFLDLLRGEKTAGRTLVLATAANERFAQRVAVHLGIFDLVLASDDKTNLSSVRKRDRLVECFGDRGFDYAGNSRVDVPIWARARGALVVNGGPGVERLAAAVAPVGRVFERPQVRLSTYVRGLRIHQWVKNLLLFVPVAAAHRLLDLELVAQAGIAFLAFGLCASSVYVVNDLLDLSADRQHP